MSYTEIDVERAVRLIKAGYMTIDDIKDAEFKAAVQAKLTA
jgi:hypothetical protein